MWVGRPTWSSISRPPKATTTRPGLAEVEVAAWSVSSPKVRCAEHVRLNVGTYSDLEILPAPHELTVRRSGDFQLALRNNGNAPTDAETRPRPGWPADGQGAVEVRAGAGDHTSRRTGGGGRPGPSRPASVDRDTRHALPADRCGGGGGGEPQRRQSSNSRRREDGAEATAAPVGAQGAGASHASSWSSPPVWAYGTGISTGLLRCPRS